MRGATQTLDVVIDELYAHEGYSVPEVGEAEF
jgi:hypothetical protein